MRVGAHKPIFNRKIRYGSVSTGASIGSPAAAPCTPLFDIDWRGLGALPAGWSGTNYDIDADGVFATVMDDTNIVLDPWAAPELSEATMAVQVLASQSGSQSHAFRIWDGSADQIEIGMSGEFASDALGVQSLISSNSATAAMTPGPTAPWDGIMIGTWVSGGSPVTNFFVYDDTGTPIADDTATTGLQSPWTPDIVIAFIGDVGPFPFRLQRWAVWPCAKTQAECDAIALDWA